MMLDMLHSAVTTLLLAASCAPRLTRAQAIAFDPALVGTWSSKSNSTFTGPGLYDPSKEQFTEPAHTGISYSFTEDGFYESAYYRALSNPGRPDCPKAMIQWQHGSYTRHANGSLVLVPIAVDGRQLLSDHCESDYAIYTRFNVTELMKGYEILTDPYHGNTRLNLVRFDGSYIMPLYLSYQPPLMLPTTTLNPMITPSSTAKPASRVRRDIDGAEEIVLPMNHKVLRRSGQLVESWNANLWWWFGVFATGAGGVMYFCF